MSVLCGVKSKIKRTVVTGICLGAFGLFVSGECLAGMIGEVCMSNFTGHDLKVQDLSSDNQSRLHNLSSRELSRKGEKFCITGESAYNVLFAFNLVDPHDGRKVFLVNYSFRTLEGANVGVNMYGDGESRYVVGIDPSSKTWKGGVKNSAGDPSLKNTATIEFGVKK